MAQKSLFKSLVQGWLDVFQGAGFIPPPGPGNTANAPANPAVVTGSYEFIIPQMFPNQSITDIPVIPPFGRDWGSYAVNSYGLSGLTGGGSTGQVPNVNQGASLYYDETTNAYIDLSQLTGTPQGA